MMLQAGTNPIIDIQIVDDSGVPVTGLMAASFPAISYVIGGANAAVPVTLSDLALVTTAYSSGGVKERTGGFYRFDLPAAAVASASTQVRLIGEVSGKRLLCPTIDVIAAPATHADAVSIAGGIAALGSPMQASSYVAPTTPPTVVQIRQEMDANSTKLANCDVLTSTRLAASGYTVPPTVAAIQAGMATHADITALGSPLQASSYVAPTTPPTVVQIRQEMDANSTKLANCDVLTSTRLAASGYTVPPTVAAIQAGMATHADITALGSPMQASSYVAPTTPPTVVQIRQEMDANSTKLANCDVLTSTRLAASGYTVPPTVAAIQAGMATHADITALGSPMQASSYTTPPSAASIAMTTASVLFVDGAANPLKVNPDHTVSSLASAGGTIANYITVPAAVAVASQDPMVIACLRGDTLRVSLPLMGNLTGRTKLVLTAKATLSDSDSMAVLQVVEGTGLTRLNGGVASDADGGNLSVANASTGAVNLVLSANTTASLAARDLVWDAQAILSTGVVSPIRGIMNVVADVTQSVT